MQVINPTFIEVEAYTYTTSVEFETVLIAVNAISHIFKEKGEFKPTEIHLLSGDSFICKNNYMELSNMLFPKTNFKS